MAYAPTADGGAQSTLPSNPTGSVEGDAASGIGAEDAGGDATSAQGALHIVSLSSTVGVLTGGKLESTDSDTVTFIAIVTNTRGLDAIAGGQLIDDTGATYGAFGAGAQKGTYTATIGWKEMNQIRALDFSAAGGEREFTAKFFDNDGDVATAKIKLKLACKAHDKTLMDACSGACVDWRVDPEHCGGCQACGLGFACKSSVCSPPTLNPEGVTNCISRASVLPATTCNDVCAIFGEICSGGYYYKSACKSNFFDDIRDFDCAYPVGNLPADYDVYHCGCD